MAAKGNHSSFDKQFQQMMETSQDPLLQSLPLDGSSSHRSKGENVAMALLNRTALSGDRIEAQFSTKIEHKSLIMTPVFRAEDSRAVKAFREQRRRLAKRKARPMSAKETRKTGFDEIPMEARKHSLYLDLHSLWSGYIREILSTGGHEAKLLKADYHGARVRVVKSSCPSFLFLQGIVVKETRQTFVISTVKDEIKTIPKRCSVFEFEAPSVIDANKTQDSTKWEIHGEHFSYRASERVGKKFKGKGTVDF